ncbi:glutamate racemase [Clostridium sp.]|uniref:glutamate racemase n=1 Tax=Clostridium sp. TaxID=1506 RepID=UPI003464CCC9
MELKSYNPIGFFDTGVGGLSVLKETIKLMPNENYVYFGDSKNAPYGSRPVKEVKELTSNAIDFLLDKGAKAIVVACNTATSVAIRDLRDKYRELPIIGIEPALKPAVEMRNGGRVVIMATPITLFEGKFSDLIRKYEKETEIVRLPCPGLVEFIEKGILSGAELHKFLLDRFEEIGLKNIGTIVLGCTHYPFIKDRIQEIVGKDVEIIDGSLGTSKELQRKLQEYNIVNSSKDKGYIKIFNSLESDDIIDLSYELIDDNR